MNEPSRVWLTLGDLDIRSNSIGFLRFLFAAFPVAHVLAMYGSAKHGFTAHFVCTLAIALALAGASWFTIEMPSLSLKHLDLFPARARSERPAE
jgi:hypothetical protein